MKIYLIYDLFFVVFSFNNLILFIVFQIFRFFLTCKYYSIYIFSDVYRTRVYDNLNDFIDGCLIFLMYILILILSLVFDFDFHILIDIYCILYKTF
jgi:hypothetical protein